MNYVSTRGRAPAAGFEDVLLAGLASDGGLYVPEVWPKISGREIEAFSSKDYADVAAHILSLFTRDAFGRARLYEIAREVYGKFDHPAVAPVMEVGEDDFILELFHGPTLAFKDFAMQVLGRLFDDALARRNERLTIIAATSGDTGAAAIDAFKSCNRVDIAILHPKGRVTDVQRKMMTTVDAPNVLNIALEGSFDDCQAIVKQLFADEDLAEKAPIGGVNSINWARLAAQTVYYFTAHAAIAAPEEDVSFIVPTGNFGDVFAGYVAKRMGLSVDKLAVATNSNDILHRAMTAGDYTPLGVTPTLSPSMDIQIASNFERLLFEANDRNADVLRAKMDEFAKNRKMTLGEHERKFIANDFVSFAVSEDMTMNEIKRHWDDKGALIDPHTAVGRAASRALRKQGALKGKTVTLSTAHPAKFPDAVKEATGKTPALPPHYQDLFDRKERMEVAPNDISAVKSMILDLAGAAS